MYQGREAALQPKLLIMVYFPVSSRSFMYISDFF